MQAERDHAKASLVHLRTELEEARSKAESERVKDSQPYRRLQMLEEDIATVSETLEGAVGGGISNAAVRRLIPKGTLPFMILTA